MKFFLTILTLSLVFTNINTASICSAQTLINELIEDVNDNGKLDCLRKPLPAPRDRPETADEKKKRLDGAWDSDCSFEADYDWMKQAKDHFGCKTGLVDKDGKAVEYPFDKQADMCEMVRALIVCGTFDGVKIDSLGEDSFQGIECPGPSDQEFQICAATSAPASRKYTWTIMLEPSALTIKDNAGSNEKPKFVLDSNSKQKIEARKAS